jgi:hypothetical protein
MKYRNMMKLYRSATYIGTRENFFSCGLWKMALFEAILAIIHPNQIFHGKNIFLK